MSADIYEKLGLFYLGKSYDGEKVIKDQPTLYKSNDLTTHAVCVGMTGSGKTGLCLSLLEEAAIDGIPIIAIDPKGDIGNLALAFNKLDGSSFKPWVDPDEAERNNCSIDEWADKESKKWKEGIESWDQSEDRIKALNNKADVKIYTPGSNAGLPVQVLKSFNAPPVDILEDTEALAEKIETTVSALLGLLGDSKSSLESSEHVFLSHLLMHHWYKGENLSLKTLIRLILKPEFKEIGALDLESFFGQKEREKLALKLNRLLASPKFSLWLKGAPMDVGSFLNGKNGKAQVSIFSISHLSESERQFFVSLLLNEIVGWVRKQPGTSSLRALLYMDEIYGYFPPTENPPTKKPMLTLLKQARAHGFGVVLATQNPVDLDYKGLSNTGTWFIGRLQTEKDREKITQAIGKGPWTKQIANLKKRCFLMYSAKKSGAELFHTRWALSYLRGPLASKEIELVMERHKAELKTEVVAEVKPIKEISTKPVIHVDEKYVMPDSGEVTAETEWRPNLMASVKAHYVSAKNKIDSWESQWYIVPANQKNSEFEFGKMEKLSLEDYEILSESNAGKHAEIDADMSAQKAEKKWQKEIKQGVYSTQKLKLFSCKELKLSSLPGESEGDFRSRIKHDLREKRDEATEKITEKYLKKIATQEERVRKAEEKIGLEKTQMKQQAASTAMSVGVAVLGAFLGRKKISTTSISKAGTAVRSAGRVGKEKGDIARAERDLDAKLEKLQDIQAELEEKLSEVAEDYGADSFELDTVEIAPRKSDLAIEDINWLWMS